MIWPAALLIAVAACIAGAALAGGLGMSAPAPAAPAPGLRHLTLSEHGDRYGYAVYIPAGLSAGTAVPLVVVMHGCTMTAGQMAAASDYDALAARDHFIVMYPDGDPLDEMQNRCWKGLYAPNLEGRGANDAGAVADMTRAVMKSWRVDPERVYAMGISAGAFEAAILGMYYPDVYAAIGIHSGAAYMGGEPRCLPNNGGTATAGALAGAGFAAMGSRARVMPVFVIHGDADDTIPYACAAEAVSQWLGVDNLVLRHEGRPAVPESSPGVRNATVPGGHAYTVLTYDDTSGCPVAQMWTVHGMGHIWSGGTSDPASSRYSDPAGPSAAVASWAFFSRWRLSGPVQPCAAPNLDHGEVPALTPSFRE